MMWDLLKSLKYGNMAILKVFSNIFMMSGEIDINTYTRNSFDKSSSITIRTFCFSEGDQLMLGMSINIIGIESFNRGALSDPMDIGGYFRTLEDMNAFQRGEKIRCGFHARAYCQFGDSTIKFMETERGQHLRYKRLGYPLGLAENILSIVRFPSYMQELTRKASSDLRKASYPLLVSQSPSADLQILLRQETVAVSAPAIEVSSSVMPAVEAETPSAIPTLEVHRMLSAFAHPHATAQTPKTPTPMEPHAGTPTQHHTSSAHSGAAEPHEIAVDVDAMMEDLHKLFSIASLPASVASSLRSSRCTTPVSASTELP